MSMKQPRQIDFGITTLRDPETGDIYMDKDGNLVTIYGEELLRQECIVALLSIRGEEPIDVEYGFPLREAMIRKDFMDPITSLKMAIQDTLKAEKIPFLAEARVVNITDDGNGNKYASVLITSVNGNSFNMALEVDTLFQSSTG